MGNSDGTFSWIHISDWHQRDEDDPQRDLMRNRLIDDIKSRESKIDERLSEIDVLIFSGDLAWRAKPEEFIKGENDLLKEVRAAISQESPPPWIVVPGNHDLDWGEVAKTPPSIAECFDVSRPTLGSDINGHIRNRVNRGYLLAPFSNFYKSSKRMGFEYAENEMVKRHTENIGERSICIVAINSALCCARTKISISNGADVRQEAWDYGALLLTEEQIETARSLSAGFDIRILVMHHPLNWLEEYERALLEHRIIKNFDIVLHGHEHIPKFTQYSSNSGEIKFIPAGSCFNTPLPSDPRYTNSYNYGVIDIAKRAGTVHHRKWSEQESEWKIDDSFWHIGRSKFLLGRKQSFRPEHREYVHRLESAYSEFQGKRAAQRHVVEISHSPVRVHKKAFIEAKIAIQTDFYDGDAEFYEIKIESSARIHSSGFHEVATKALQMISVYPTPIEVYTNNSVKYHAKCKLGPHNGKIHYKYRMLTSSDGVWFHRLKQYTDYLTITVNKAPGYEYDCLASHGVPPLKRQDARRLVAETINGESQIPNQGYIVQWYRGSRSG